VEKNFTQRRGERRAIIAERTQRQAAPVELNKPFIPFYRQDALRGLRGVIFAADLTDRQFYRLA